MNIKLVQSLKRDPVKYAHLLGFTLLTDLHNDWIRKMILEKEDFTLLGHRGSYKTTCLSFAFALLIVLKPDKTIFFIRKTDDDVIEIVTQTRKILESTLFTYIVKEIYGIDLVLTTASAYKIDTNLNTSNRGQVQLQGMGLNGSITGKHADYVFTDDIVNLKDRISRAEREQTKRQYQELQNIKNRDGRIANTGTPWHKDDAISTEMPNVSRFTVYDTGLISEAQQRQLRASMSPSLYAANYELKHIADGDSLFSEPVFLDGDVSAIFGGRSHVDAAYGGADYTAFTIMRKVKGGYIAYGKLWHGHVSQHINDMLSLHRKYRAGSISCEKNGDKGFLARDLRNVGFAVTEYSEKENKYIKIATHLKKEWANIRWLPETDPEYLAQILDYTENAEHDDAPDSAASLLRQFEKCGHIGDKASILYGR